jgi:hypothetical protein
MFKVIALYLMLGLQAIALAGNTNCNNAIAACENLVKEQDTSIAMLKQRNTQLENEVVDAENRAPLLPWYVYVLTGVVAGFVVSAVVK